MVSGQLPIITAQSADTDSFPFHETFVKRDRPDTKGKTILFEIPAVSHWMARGSERGRSNRVHIQPPYLSRPTHQNGFIETLSRGGH